MQRTTNMGILDDFRKKYGACEKRGNHTTEGEAARGMTSKVHMKHGGRMKKAEGERIPAVTAYAAGGGTPSFIPSRRAGGRMGK